VQFNVAIQPRGKAIVDISRFLIEQVISLNYSIAQRERQKIRLNVVATAGELGQLSARFQNIYCRTWTVIFRLQPGQSVTRRAQILSANVWHAVRGANNLNLPPEFYRLIRFWGGDRGRILLGQNRVGDRPNGREQNYADSKESLH
jgi:hypothetical protein